VLLAVLEDPWMVDGILNRHALLRVARQTGNNEALR
jgi:hypothetical protein